MAVVVHYSSTNGTQTLDYVRGNGKGHNGHQIRNLVISNIACSSDIDTAKMMMQTEWNRPHRAKVQAHHYVQSFSLSELDPKNKDDISKCNELGNQLAKKIIGKRHLMAIIATQRDGKGGKLHNHIVICNQDYMNGKALAGIGTNIKNIRRKNDQVLRENHMQQPEKLIDEYTDNTALTRKLQDAGKYSWKGDLQERIDQAQMNSTNWNEYFENLDNLGVSIRAFKKRAFENGKLVDSTQKLKTITYTFIGQDDKEHKCRATRLGSNYDFDVTEQKMKIVKEMRKGESRRDEESNATVNELAGEKARRDVNELANAGYQRIEQQAREYAREQQQSRRFAEEQQNAICGTREQAQSVGSNNPDDDAENAEYRRLMGIDHELEYPGF